MHPNAAFRWEDRDALRAFAREIGFGMLFAATQDGPRVAVVDAHNQVSLRAVKLGRDLGRSVEVTSGLSPQDKVVLNPPDTIDAGERVLAKAAPPDKP